MKAIIHQSLGNVNHFNSSLFKSAAIQNEFVGHPAVFSAIQHWVVGLQHGFHKVGIQYGNLG